MTRFGADGWAASTRGAALAVGLLVLALAGPSPVAAQMEEEDGGTFGVFDVAGFVGLLTPVANLTEDPESFATVIDPYLALGVDLTYWLSERFGIDVTGVYSPSELAVRSTQFQGAIPDDLGDATFLAGTLSAVYRFRSSGSGSALEPYVAGGFGLKRVSVDEIAAPEVESTTDPAATLAAGIRTRIVERFTLRIEVRDFASYFESPTTGDSKLQNDVVVTVGVGAGLP